MSRKRKAPILVLGIGNTLLGDDGAGMDLMRRLARWSRNWHGAVEYLAGGTQGIALLDAVAGRYALVILDAIALGAPPGTVHLLQGEEVLALSRHAASSRQASAGELLAAAVLLGEVPERLFMVGIEPACLTRRRRLSRLVRRAIPEALGLARNAIVEALETRFLPAAFDFRQPCEWPALGGR
jgi:hydrogenase maturation protease